VKYNYAPPDIVSVFRRRYVQSAAKQCCLHVCLL